MYYKRVGKMPEIAIKVENLSKIYKLYDKPIDRMKEALSIKRKNYHHNHYALKNISFEVKKGETLGIVGSNGSGKSTLLKIITGVLNPSSGDVKVNGKISALLELGAGFNPEYTGIENIYLNGTMMGYTKEEIDSKMESMLEFADIGEFVYQAVKTYSSGMFVRLAFAVAINVDPDILIIDEALAVGDTKFQSKCFKKIDEFKKKGKTILIVTHDVGSIKRFCDSAIWINSGILMDHANAKSVAGKYLENLYDTKNSLEEKNTEIKNESLTQKLELKPISRWGSDCSAIKRVDLFGENKVEGYRIDNQSIISLNIFAEIKKKYLNEENLYISSTIRDIKGQDIIFMTTKKMEFIGKEEGLYHINFEIDNVLSSGKYYFVTCLEIRDDSSFGVAPQYIDFIEGSIYFEVPVEENRKYSIVDIDYNRTLIKVK